jgi:hypothetical protein
MYRSFYQMTQSDRVSQLLQGAVDLHVHSGPGLIPRSLDHVEAAREAMAAGMRALVVKDQHSMTGNAVYFINKYIIRNEPFDVFAGLVLNNAAGGLNPNVVDAAIKYGAKIVWMPTSSARNHIEIHQKMESSFPHTKEKLFPETPLTILDEKGKILPQVKQICSLIAEADIILGTGHLHLSEIKLLVEEAQKAGIKRILMQHPEFLVEASIDEQVELAKKGVWIEHSLALFLSGACKKEYLVEMIRGVGSEYTTLGSDLGQMTNPRPVAGIRTCVQYLLENGIKDEEIDLMLRKNPAKLVNLE